MITEGLNFQDVLIKPIQSDLESRSEVNLTTKYNMKHSGKTLECVPVVAANMDTIGTIEMGEVLNTKGCMVALHKHQNPQQLNYKPCEFFKHNFYTIGLDPNGLDDIHELENVIGNQINICIDIANGYIAKFPRFIEQARKEFPNNIIMAGNVATGDGANSLIHAGADIVKVGIGPGSVCETRKLTGVGVPQLSAIMDCADVAHHLRAHICADGGCTRTGDICKAFGAGADLVMIGGMLAGHSETGADQSGPSEFYGMSSDTALDKYYDGKQKYRASEGKTVLVDPKGSVLPAIEEILGGIRSCCTYVGARNIKELKRKVSFIKTTQQENTVYN